MLLRAIKVRFMDDEAHFLVHYSLLRVAVLTVFNLCFLAQNTKLRLRMET